MFVDILQNSVFNSTSMIYNIDYAHAYTYPGSNAVWKTIHASVVPGHADKRGH